MSNTIKYIIGNKAYINMTNECSNSCDFCVRNSSDGVEGYHLWLDREPTVAEVIAELSDAQDYEEVVFCGFGEPTYRLRDILLVAKFVKDKGVKTRINTNGQGSLIAGEDISRLMSGLIDTVSISLNATNAAEYQKLCHSIYGETSFYAMLDFARECKKHIPNVVLSVVDIIGDAEIAKARIISENLGVALRVRQMIN